MQEPPAAKDPKAEEHEIKSKKKSGSVLVYTASGLSPILPGPMGDENDSDGESEDGFESSTWVDQPRLQVMPMEELNKLRGVAKKPLPGPSEYVKKNANSLVLSQCPVSAFAGPLCGINRDNTSKLTRTIKLSANKPGPGAYMTGGHTPFKDTTWGGFPSRKDTGKFKVGNATRDGADKLSSVPHHKAGSAFTPGPGSYRRFWQKDTDRPCRFSFGEQKLSWLGERGLDPFKHKKQLKKIKRYKWWEITYREQKLMDPGSAFYHINHKQVRKHTKLGRFGRANRFGNTYGEHFFASFQ